MQNRAKALSATIAGLALVVVLVSGNTYSANERSSRTTPLVPSTNIECAGAPACVSTTFPAVTVQAGHRQSTHLACPQSHPNLWGWDVAQHEHIQVDRVASDIGTATIEGINKADFPGEFIVSLGCSTEPVTRVTGTQMLKTRILARTDTLQKRKPRVIGQPASLQAEDPCTIGGTVPNCQAQQQVGFFMWGWHTGRLFFDCKGPYPYVWNYTYTEADGSGVTSIGYQFEESPQSFDIWFTNWSIYQTGTILVTLACSKTNSWAGGGCGPIIDDPMCSVLPDTTKFNCSKAFPGVCFATYQERCSASDPILDCTIDTVFFPPWCQAAC
jgi:hypothetical protein